jgi:hypothetical protein
VARERGEKYNKKSESSIKGKQKKFRSTRRGRKPQTKNKSKKLAIWLKKTHLLPVVVCRLSSAAALTDTRFSQWVFLCLMGNQVRKR